MAADQDCRSQKALSAQVDLSRLAANKLDTTKKKKKQTPALDSWPSARVINKV